LKKDPIGAMPFLTRRMQTPALEAMLAFT